MHSRTLAELLAAGYSEDRASKRAFERRYAWVTIPGALLVFVPYPLTRYGWQPFADPVLSSGCWLVCLPVGILLCFGAAIHAMRAVPTSLQSGLPMQCFLRSDAPPDHTEHLYVDPGSRTYFIRLVSVSH